ncbi:hypothetical protein ACIBF5_17165 [Micromonospora sp. NPDC050417]|uniref:hypothetical protein n=1 Tax=Micromonospora sp. NPDC050417 TaxID=3364280 RepID=UPI0037AA88E3
MLSAAVVAAPTPGPSPTPGPPRIVVDQARPAAGDRITVRLTGWPVGPVSIELCGNAGRRGSVDCAVHASVQTSVAAAGAAAATLTVTVPPVGCPCVVRVTTIGGGTSGVVPLTIEGVPVTELPDQGGEEPDDRAILRVTRVEVSADRSWPALFGGPAARTLLVGVRNDGTAPVVDPSVTVSFGRDAEPTGFVPPPLLGTLRPGEERVIRLPLTIPAPAVGHYTVRGEIDGIGRPAGFSATVATYPWGLVGVAAGLIGLLALVELRRPRRVRDRPNDRVG